MKKVFAIVMVVLVVALLFGCGSTTPAPSQTPTPSPTSSPSPTPTSSPAPKELVIGAIQGLTGMSSEAGMLGVHGQEAYVEYINGKGGINIKGEQYKIVLKGADFASTPDGAVTAYNKLVYQDGVKFLVGAPFAPVFQVLGELAEKDQVFMVNESGAGQEISPQSTTTFVTQPVQAMLKHSYETLHKLYPDVKKIAIFAPDEPIGIVDVDFSKKEAEAQGFEVVATAWYPPGETNYQPLMTKLLAANPDAMASGMGFTGWKASAIKQARELGWNGPMLEVTCSGDVRDTVGMLGQYASDFITGSYDASDPNMPGMAKEISAIIQQKYGEPFTVDHITQGWQPVSVIVEAIEMAQSTDPVEVRNALEKASTIQTPFGEGHIGGLQTFGYNNAITRPSVCYRIMDGKINLIDWYTPILP